MQAFWFAAAVTLLLFVTRILSPTFVVDSWSYLELSKTVFHDFYRYNTLRGYENQSPYSQAFPLLWPVILAVARQVADLGIYTGYILNFFVCIALLAALIRLCRMIDLPGWVGAAAYLALLGYPPFFGEALGGKTFPLVLAFFTAALILIAANSTNWRHVLLAGLIMGLASLTRFDSLAVACAIGMAFVVRAFQAGRNVLRTAMIYYVAVGVVLSPMVAYGIKRFGRPFPSADARSVPIARGVAVSDYFATPPASDLTQQPARWATGFVLYKVPRLLAVGVRGAEDSPLPVLIAATLVAWGASRRLKLPGRAIPVIGFALLLIPVMLLPAALVGLKDTRYFSGAILILFVTLFSALVSLDPTAWHKGRAAILLFVLALPLVYQAGEKLAQARGRLAGSMAPLSPTRQMQEITEAVRRDSGGQPHRLVLTSGHIAAAKYGALTGEPVSIMPTIRNGSFADFARDFHITHVHNGVIDRAPWEPPRADPAEVMRSINVAGVELVPLDLPGLYRIRIGSERAAH